MEFSKHKRSKDTTFESMLAFITNPEAVKERLAELALATEESDKATKRHVQAVAQVVEAKKLTVALTAAQEDRGKAREELENAVEASKEMKEAAKLDADTVRSHAKAFDVEKERGWLRRNNDQDAREIKLGQREQVESEKMREADILIAEAKAEHQRVIAMHDDVEAKARRTEEAARS